MPCAVGDDAAVLEPRVVDFLVDCIARRRLRMDESGASFVIRLITVDKKTRSMA